jgi:hypothetical protein
VGVPLSAAVVMPQAVEIATTAATDMNFLDMTHPLLVCARIAVRRGRTTGSARTSEFQKASELHEHTE